MYNYIKRHKGITMVERTCLVCSKPFNVRLSYIKRNKGEGKYCSNKCKMSTFKGKPKTPEHLAKISGPNANNWQVGKTSENQIIRHRKEHRLWREAVYARDNWTCQHCKKRGGRLEAHHIKPFSLFPELRTSIENGITLCKKCHLLTDTFGHKINRINKK